MKSSKYILCRCGSRWFWYILIIYENVKTRFGMVLNGGDCDDENPSIFPSITGHVMKLILM